MNNQNEQAFYYEICNVWNNDNNVSKNFQSFFIFSYTKGDSYFKTPNLSLKIKSKSDYDNTEVKLYATYETLPDLIVTLENYNVSCNNINEGLQLAGHNFTLFVSTLPDNKCRLKLTNSDNTSNDIILSRNVLINYTRTLRMTYDNIINLSLSFIKLSQNNEILERLNSIEDNMRRNSNVISTVKQDVTNYTPNFNMDPIIDTDELDMPSSIPAPVIHNETENVNKITQSIEDIKIQAEEAPFEIDDSCKIVEQPKTVTNANSMQDAFMNAVNNAKNEKPVNSLRSKIISFIKDVFNKKMSVMEMVNMTIVNYAMLSDQYNSSYGDIGSLSDMSAFFNTSYSAFMLYFKKLAFIVEKFDLVKDIKKVPMFIMRVRYPEMYAKMTQLLNEALLSIYEEYRSKTETTDEDVFILTCMKYVFAPFWSSYLNVADISGLNSSLYDNLKLKTSMFLNDWEKTYMNKLDQFIYNNGLAFDYKSTSNIERFFSSVCPTVNECFNTEPEINDVKTIETIVKTLKTTYNYEELKWLNTDIVTKLSNQFVLALKTFDKKNNITEDTNDDDMHALYTKTCNDNLPENVRQEFKGLTAIDNHIGDISVNLVK